MKSGIYKITNIINNDCYIGSSKDIIRRKKDHFRTLRQNKSHCKILQYAYNKYGEDNFKFELIAKCPVEYLFKLEQWFVDSLNPKYNICKIDVSVPIGLNYFNYKNKEKYSILAKQRINSNCNFGWKSRKIAKLNDNGDIMQLYNSLKEYASIHNCSIGNVGKALKKGNKCKGFYIKYI